MPALPSAIRVVDVEGTAAQRGAALGSLLRDETGSFFDAWRGDIRARVGVDAATFAPRFLARTRFLDEIDRVAPDLLVEVLAMADAAGIDRDQAVAAQLVDETWLLGPSLGAEDAEHCSTIGVAHGDRVVIGQNMDLEEFRHGHQLLVRHHRADGPDLMLLASPGVLAFNGLNDRGVGLCVNALGALGGRPEGLPVAFMIRALLERTTAADAAAFVVATPHASGQHYLVGGPDGLHALEGGPAGVDPLDAGDLVLHTNHVLSGTRAAGPAGPEDDFVESLADSTHARLDSIRADMTSGASLQDALSSLRHPVHPVCRRLGTGPNFTFASTVMELTDGPRLHVSAGPPDEHPYTTVTFS